MINSNDGSNTEINAISTQLNLGSDDTGYIAKVLDDIQWASCLRMEWSFLGYINATPQFLGFKSRLDFGIGSDNIRVKNSAMLLQALEEEPEIQAFCRNLSQV